MKRFNLTMLLLFLFFGLTGLPAEANDKWQGGSAYSHFGLGLPYDFNATSADGMGVTGVAMHDTFLPSMANPAAWSRAGLSNISGSFEINNFNASFEDSRNNSTRLQTGPFQVLLPVKRDNVGVSLSFSPLTSARFATENEYPLPRESNNAGEDMRYIIENRGDGGINRFELGIGVRLTRSISVGYAPSLLLGVVNRNENVIFSNPDYRPVTLNESTSHFGFGNRFGLYISNYGFLRSNDRISAGATISLPVNFRSERKLETRIDGRDITVREPSEYGDGQTTFPLEASAGFSYNFNPYFIISADMLYQNWSEYINFEGHSESFLKDRMKFGLGTQYIAAHREGSTIFSRFVYRFGVSYDTGSLVLDGNNIETLSINAGFGIPSRTYSSIDINAEYGFRGTQESQLIAERIFTLKLSFNLSERMFFQRLLQ